ncbi:hypothetical protein CHS0354_011483 [Potamilus streckersoni]|uniref:Uncharacterized protein n=1 Tax=Potamilus streckersoni TaxID=2493646 RepID=A0AAE0VXR0_9BIVA|nr:hypothetical protein CHS0354_011483 [Potamilus streckersoni]
MTSSQFQPLAYGRKFRELYKFIFGKRRTRTSINRRRPHRFDRLSDYDEPLSSTLLKKVPIPRRHMDTFGGYGYEVGAKKGVILHTDRYQWEGYRSLDFMNQRERLQAEFEYMEKLRGIKRRREVMPHRSNLDLLMGGKKMEFCERFEIQREIQKLKSLILPQNARDLYHGRGFRLPEDHNSMKPRRAPALDLDLDDQMSHLQNKLSFDPETGRAQPRFHRQGESDSSLPKINNRGYLLGTFTNVCAIILLQILLTE